MFLAQITRCGHVYCWSCLLHYLELVSLHHVKVLYFPFACCSLERQEMEKMSNLLRVHLQKGFEKVRVCVCVCVCVCAHLLTQALIYGCSQSVVALKSHQFNVGDVLRMKLMKRKKVHGHITQCGYCYVCLLCPRVQIVHFPSHSGTKRSQEHHLPKVRSLCTSLVIRLFWH